MVKHIKRAALLLCISLLSLHFVPAHAQEGFNNKKVLYGLHWGFTDNRVDLYYSDVEGIAHPLDQGNHSFFAPGTRLNVMCDVRLGNYFRLRVMPGVLLTGRNWEPTGLSIPTSSTTDYKVISVCGELPVDIKFYLFRWEQLYLTSGLSYSFDFTSLNKDINEGTIQRLNAHDFRYICGLGYEFDTRYVRLGIELKATFGLPSSDIIIGTRPETFYYHSGPTVGFGFIIEA